MKKAHYNWKIPKDIEISTDFHRAIESEGIPEYLGKLLYQRGITTEEKLKHFLYPDVSQLHDPFLLHDMERAVARILLAVQNGENILIYGDYDADGITATTVLKEAIETVGGNVRTYLPNRFTDGYGPNLEVYKYFIETEKIDFIVTVDNGVSGHEAIQYAKEKGVDVVVTDHHEMPQHLPDAFAIVHPKHPEGNYPFRELAGVGVAFKVATALLGEVPMESLDMVAIGTVADMVSLLDENRLLVQMGLQMIRQGGRIGLEELLSTLKEEAETVDATSIGFRIAPSLNALGRLGDANPAVTLFTTFDEEEARNLAFDTVSKNEERKSISEAIATEIEAMLEEKTEQNAYVFAKEGWHEGVLGLVAGRIMNKIGKPVVVLTMVDGGLAKGSARSVEAVNLFHILDNNRALFQAVGGHHAAAGMTLPIENIPSLEKLLNDEIEKLGVDLSLGMPLEIAESIHVNEVSVDSIEDLKRIAPFGMDFPEPYFVFENVGVTNLTTIGQNGLHLKGSLVDGEDSLPMIYFSAGAEIGEFHSTPRQSVVGKLSVNEWNGKKTPQLMVEDYCVQGLQVFDARGKQTNVNLPFQDGLFLYFDSKDQRLFSKMFLPNKVVFESVEQVIQVVKEKEIAEIVLVDVPDDLSILPSMIEETEISRVYLIAACPDEAYLHGVGTREQFAHLFQLIQKQKRLNVRAKFKEIAQFLKIPSSLFVYMVKVFEELGFVNIEEGMLTAVEHPEKKELSQSLIYQNRLQKMKNQEFFVLNSVETITDFLEGKKERI